MSSTSATANWADLWDQSEIVSAHTQKGIDHLEKYGILVKERAAIEEDYASKLRALVKKNLGKKKEEESANSFTYTNAFHAILHEVESLAGQHEVIAENLRKEVHPLVHNKCASLRAARKDHLNELHIIHGVLSSSIDNMIKYQKSYCKAFKEAEMAHIKYDKAEKNMDLSRADLEKAKNNAMQRTQMFEDAKQNYAHALQAANQQQHQHFNQLLPQILERLRVVDEERIAETREVMLKSIEIETKVMSIMQRCYDEMSKAANSISANCDAASLVEQQRSGYAHPQPFPFEDLGTPSASTNGEGSISNFDTIRRPAKNGSMVRVNRKPSMGLFRANTHMRKDGSIDFRSYPPQQRCRRLQHEIENLEKEIAKNHQSREGAAKMLQVYKDNPKLGNANDVDTEIAVYAKKCDALTQQLAKYKAMLDEARAELNMPISAVGCETPSRSAHPHSGFNTPTHSSPRQFSTNSIEVNNHCSSYSEESLSSDGSARQKASPINLNKSSSVSVAPIVDKCDVYEECDMPVLGTCTALYAFSGDSEGTTTMLEGDRLLVLERDEGDGWTRVKHVNSTREGFVPTSYLSSQT